MTKASITGHGSCVEKTANTKLNIPTECALTHSLRKWTGIKNAVFLQLQTRRNIKNVRRCGELSANSNDQCKHGSESAFTRGRGMLIHGY